MLISLPARVGYLYSSTFQSSPHLAQHMSLCALTGLTLLASTSHAAAGEASWLQFSSAAKQSCRSGLPACHEGAAEWHAVVAGAQIARPQWTSTDTAASGTLRLRSEVGSLRPSEVESLSASSTGENARCECLPAENAV